MTSLNLPSKSEIFALSSCGKALQRCNQIYTRSNHCSLITILWYQERLECTIFKWVASPTFFIGGKPERAQHRRYKWEILCMYFYYHTIVTRVPAWSHEVCRASNITNRVHDFRDCKRITRTLYFVTRSIWGFQHRIHIHGFMSAAKTLATRLLNRGCSQTTIKHLMHKCNYRHV